MHIDATTTLVQPVAASVLAMSAGRLGSFVAGVLALIGVIAGAVALSRASGRAGPGGGLTAGLRREGAKVATALGMVGIAVGAVVAVTADGGVGTGNGLGGAFVAILLGLTSVVLGGLARSRSRRAA